MQPTDLNRRGTRLVIVGAGRLGSTLARALQTTAGFEVAGPFGREEAAQGLIGAAGDVVLLCVPDDEIARAASAIRQGPMVGHCSGATGLEALAPHEAFSVHPLMTITDAGARLDGVTAAVDGTSARALATAEALARALKMEVIHVIPEDRAAYHAAASIASNFLVTLEAAAERLGATAGVERHMLVPLVRATVENWAALGGERALTGPVARGDHVTVERQRAAVAERTPELLSMFDALTDATRTLAESRLERT